jgi:hypothetical protein
MKPESCPAARWSTGAHLLEVLLRSVPREAIRFGTVLRDIEILPDRVG